MASRRKIVIPFLTNYAASTGIVIYLSNLVKHFQALDDSIKPYIIILYNDQSPLEEIRSIKYPYISYVHEHERPFIIFRIINKISRSVIGREVFPRRIKADSVYPAFESEIFSNIPLKIFWKEDFQESYYPELFRESDLEFVRNFFNVIRKNPGYHLVLSSYSAGADLRKFYDGVTNPLHYLRFVSVLPEIPENRFIELDRKYNVGQKYFIVCNQFWPHKNHITLIRALDLLVKKGRKDFKVVFTGKTTSARNENYFSGLEQEIKSRALSSHIVITGFLERSDQLLLMKKALAVIQPSLFEGWSTVIEDAKAMKKIVIAADLDVNIEQLDKNVYFFPRQDELELAKAMEHIWDHDIDIQDYDYEENIQRFRNDLVQLFRLS